MVTQTHHITVYVQMFEEYNFTDLCFHNISPW